MGFEPLARAGLVGRGALLFSVGLLLSGLLLSEDYSVLAILLLIALSVTAVSLWRHICRVDREMSRFIDAIRFGDLGQSFGSKHDGPELLKLGAALDRAMQHLRHDRVVLAGESRIQAALVDSAPVAIVTIDSEDRIDMMNGAARRLLRLPAGSRIGTVTMFGDDFLSTLAHLEPGTRRVASLVIDETPQRAMFTASALRLPTGVLRVIAIQPIQSALNEAELVAQTDLVRVLTHEIMNSITPVTSLARTAADLLARLVGQNEPGLVKARKAIDTLAARADGIMQFVETYRQVSRPLRLRRKFFSAAAWADDLMRLMEADPASKHVTFKVEVEPPSFEIDADPDLLTQMALNILRNATEAVKDRGSVRLGITRSDAGRARIEIEDDGPGIVESNRREVFLPFFTTKAKGTGVGLSLSRQVALAHGGSILIETGSTGGARIRIVI